MTDTRLMKYWSGWYGQRLLEKHTLLTEGLWHVKGEGDENGMRTPHIAYVRGVLQDVVACAVQHPSFYSWGAGGTIELIEINVLTTADFAAHIKELESIRVLEQELRDRKAKASKI